MPLQSFVTVGELAKALNGRLELGSLPPLEGTLTVVGRICTDIDRVGDGDVYWAVDGMRNSSCQFVEEAYARGAAGIVAAGYRGVPWSGRWAVHVADGGAALLSAAFHTKTRGLKIAGIQEPSQTNATKSMPTALCRKVPIGPCMLLDWSRNATADLWSRALEELRGLDMHGRRWIVCGDLCSLQWDHGAMHRRIGTDAVRLGNASGLVACGQFAHLVILGAQGAGLSPARTIACRHIRQAIDFLRYHLAAGDSLLVAGSRHLNIVPVVEYFEQHHRTQAA
ncbi:MAG: hypothetical protein JW829_00285 [Pirellulales bacterium]|nr:hypothetical protein [Pirellulales bacterium]